MKLKTLIGKTMNHKSYGLVEVTGVPKNSRKFVEVKVVQRREGWHEQNQRYERYKVVRPNEGTDGNTIYWYKNRNDEYGTTDTVNIDELNNQEFAEHFGF